MFLLYLMAAGVPSGRNVTARESHTIHVDIACYPATDQHPSSHTLYNGVGRIIGLGTLYLILHRPAPSLSVPKHDASQWSGRRPHPTSLLARFAVPSRDTPHRLRSLLFKRFAPPGKEQILHWFILSATSVSLDAAAVA